MRVIFCPYLSELKECPCEYEQKCTTKPKAIVGMEGKNLACWCNLSEPCHADVLLKILKENLPDVSISKKAEQK